MLLGKAGTTTSTATIISFFLFLAPRIALAQDIEVTGSCNVINSRSENINNVTYSINCNNISTGAADRIEQVLKLIESASENFAGNEFEDSLYTLLKNSESGLAELKKSRAPHIKISLTRYDDCDDCPEVIEIRNTGGEMRRISDILIINLVSIRIITSGENSACPFQGACPKNNWIDIDYPQRMRTLFDDRSFFEGDIILYEGFSSDEIGQEIFERDVFKVYQKREKHERHIDIPTDVLKLCTIFEYSIGIKVSMVTYHGNAYDEYFSYKVNRTESGVEFSIDKFSMGKDGFEKIQKIHDASKSARSWAGGETENSSFAAILMWERSVSNTAGERRR
ncbi:MAG: hypothetical protein QM682_05040 [Paracoccus sp. (in: a-proteobacteria)]|uniref:hypothetical protein n=1 Tax=Paracoccus sp. TaxID=267 RepID=UPI0039E42DFE